MDIDIFQLKSSLLSRLQVRVGHRQLSMDYEQHSDPYSSRIRATPLIGSQNVFRRHCTASGSGYMSVVVGGCSNIRINVDSYLSRRPMNWGPPRYLAGRAMFGLFVAVVAGSPEIEACLLFLTYSARSHTDLPTLGTVVSELDARTYYFCIRLGFSSNLEIRSLNR